MSRGGSRVTGVVRICEVCWVQELRNKYFVILQCCCKTGGLLFDSFVCKKKVVSHCRPHHYGFQAVYLMISHCLLLRGCRLLVHPVCWLWPLGRPTSASTLIVYTRRIGSLGEHSAFTLPRTRSFSFRLRLLAGTFLCLRTGCRPLCCSMIRYLAVGIVEVLF